MVEDITERVVAFVREATGVRKRVTRPEPSPQERRVSDLMEDLVDRYGTEITYEAKMRMPGNHPLRGCISATKSVELVVGDFEATLRAGDISTGQPSSCSELFFKLVAEPVSSRPRRALTLANVDPYGRVTDRGRRRLGPKELVNVELTIRFMEQKLSQRAQADENWKIFPHITA